MLPLWLRLVAILAAHPMHTTVSEIAWNRASGQTRLRVRGFADDLGAAAANAEGGASSDSAAPRYVLSRLTICDGSGRAVAIVTEAVEHRGDAVVVLLSGMLPRGLHDVRIGNRLLVERFADQINIVRVTGDGRALSLLFTRGDGPKALP